ncbi:MAG TPA: kelch repeat-containing protein [Planctomycetota bacterium]|nr:kelch repeat-containing protein [Planctomycetota bacterium]
MHRSFAAGPLVASSALALLTASLSSSLAAQLQWQLVSLPQSPPPRYGHTVDGWNYVFGGRDAGQAFADAWVFVTPLIGWQPMPTVTAPSPRSRHAMATGLLFGGEDFAGQKNAETWVFTTTFGSVPLGQPFASSWTQMAPAHAPSARSGHAMTSFAVGQWLLFGGETAAGVSGESWVFAAGDWHQVVSSPSPPARSGHVLLPLSAGCLLLGGGDGTQVFGDAWLFDGQQWQSLPGVPFAATGAGVAHDYFGRLRHAFLCGRDATGALRTIVQERGDRIDDGVWYEHQVLGAMPAREQSVAFTYFGFPYYVFGGRDAQGQVLGDTWRLAPTHVPSSVLIGSGCGPGSWSNEGPELWLPLPSLLLGSTRDLRMFTHTPGTLSVIGLQLGTAPAPQPCQITLLPDALLLGLSSTLIADFTISLHVPFVESLRGLDISVQAIAFEATGPGGIAISKVGLIHVGD